MIRIIIVNKKETDLFSVFNIIAKLIALNFGLLCDKTSKLKVNCDN